MKFYQKDTLLARTALVLIGAVLIFHFYLSGQIGAAVFTWFGWGLLVGAAILSLVALALCFARHQQGWAMLLSVVGLLVSIALLIFYFPSPKTITLSQLVPDTLPLAQVNIHGARQEAVQQLWQDWSQVGWQPLVPDWSPKLMLQGQSKLDWSREAEIQFLFYPTEGGGRLTVTVFRYSDHYAVIRLTPSQGREIEQLCYTGQNLAER